ncbi:MAG: hypothetical protein GC179_05320 [Anaerolineaceae bacterium]|nr:hypothetical protein [Anaerolineaceae bacterium]
MSISLIVFLAVVFTTFVEFQLLWDGQFLTYPMFRWIQQQDKTIFVRIHQTYVKNLGIPTYLPSLLYLVSVLLFLFIRPVDIPIQFPILLNILNFVGVVSTFVQLVPLHIRIDRTQTASVEDVNRLLRYNRIRFIMVTINSVVILYLLALRLM